MMVAQGVTHVVMEVSSHALELGRVNGTQFAVAGFSNLSQDHLDFHPTMQDYFQAKARLFRGELAAHKAAIVVDEQWGRDMAVIAADSAQECWRAGIQPMQCTRMPRLSWTQRNWQPAVTNRCSCESLVKK